MFHFPTVSSFKKRIPSWNFNIFAGSRFVFEKVTIQKRAFLQVTFSGNFFYLNMTISEVKMRELALFVCD